MSKKSTMEITLSPVVKKGNKIQWLDPKALTGSENPRKSATKQGLEELKGSILANGILSPILAYSRKDKKDLIIISGHRRTQAAIELNQTQVPVIVVDAEDYQAAEAALVDNIQREDLEPIDEAEAMAAVRDSRKLSIKEVAIRCGKSETYVYRRLRLLDLPDNGRKALRDRKMTLGVVLIFLRIHDKKLLTQAINEFLRGFNMDEDEAIGIVSSYTNRLKEAPFDITSDKLWSAAGPCTKCPKRSTTQNLLFDEAQKDDYCLDAKCWDNKARIIGNLKTKSLKNSGAKILKKAPQNSYTSQTGEVELFSNATVVDLDAICNEDRKQRTYKKLIGKDLDPKDVAAFQQKNGRLRVFMDRAKAYARIKAAGIKLPSFDKGSSVPLTKAQKSSRALKAIKEKARLEACNDARANVVAAKTGNQEKDIKALALLLATSVQGTPVRLFAQRHKIKPKKSSWGGPDYRPAVETYLQGLGRMARLRSCIELLLTEAEGNIYGADEAYQKALKIFGVDFGNLRARNEKKLRDAKAKKDKARAKVKPKKKAKPRRSKPKNKK